MPVVLFLILIFAIFKIVALVTWLALAHIFVARGEAMLDISGFLLTAEYYYYTESGWDLEAEVPWMQGVFEGVQ
jgi:hypothetical protein